MCRPLSASSSGSATNTCPNSSGSPGTCFPGRSVSVSRREQGYCQKSIRDSATGASGPLSWTSRSGPRLRGGGDSQHSEADPPFFSARLQVPAAEHAMSRHVPARWQGCETRKGRPSGRRAQSGEADSSAGTPPEPPVRQRRLQRVDPGAAFELSPASFTILENVGP